MSLTQLLILKSIRFFVISSDKISKKITAKLLVNLFFRPKRNKHPERELAYLESATKFDFSYQNIDVKGYKWGNPSKKRVLLVHGWAGRGTQLHQYIDPLIDKGFEVFSFDGIAHGLTAGKETNMPGMSFLLKQMMKTYQIDYIIAHSFGGMATTFAIKRNVISPKSVVFMGAPYDINYILESFLTLFGLEGKYEKSLIAHIEKKTGLAYTEFDLDTYPNTTTTNLLLIHDENDREVSFAEMEKYLPMWENVETVITQGLGHRRILKDSKIIDKIINFISVNENECKYLRR